MPLYFSPKVDLNSLQAQPHRLIDVTNLQPHEFKSHNLVGLRDALKPLIRIFYPSATRVKESHQNECKNARVFLELLDKVFIPEGKEKRPQNTEIETERLLEIYEGKFEEEQQRRLQDVLRNRSAPVFLDIICNINEKELLSLEGDLEQYGTECEALPEPLCKRLRKARQKSRTFANAWAAWEEKEREKAEKAEAERTEPGSDRQLSSANTRESTSIQLNESTTTSPNSLFDDMQIDSAQADIPTGPPLSQQIDSSSAAIHQSTGPPAKRVRREEFSQDTLSQSQQSSCVRDREPSWTNSELRTSLCFQSLSYSRLSFAFISCNFTGSNRSKSD
jgi:hypothetical protein